MDRGSAAIPFHRVTCCKKTMEIFSIISVLQHFSLLALPTVGYIVLLIIFTTLLRITIVLVTFIFSLCALDIYFSLKIFPFIEEE